MRQQIRDELSKIDSEYAWVSIRSIAPDEFQQLHPAVRPSKDATVPKVEPFVPERAPEPGTVEIKEGQTGISYRKLFAPYLRGARTVTLVDPYLRLDYQIYNLMSFIDLLDPDNGALTLQVITAADSNEEEVPALGKTDQLQESANAKKVTFTYSFDRTKHDRQIETDTGWRITLGRGLDIFHRIEGRFSLVSLTRPSANARKRTSFTPENNYRSLMQLKKKIGLILKKEYVGESHWKAFSIGGCPPMVTTTTFAGPASTSPMASMTEELMHRLAVGESKPQRSARDSIEIL